jgi:hypothetical protein
MQALLWYTEFDEIADDAARLFQNGTIVTQDPSRPDDAAGKTTPRPPWQKDRYMVLGKMPRTRDGDRKVSCSIHFSTTRLRVPDGTFDPNRVYLQFNIWTSEPGDVTVLVKAGTKVSGNLSVPRPNQWCPLKIAFGSLAGKGDRMRPDALVQELRITFAPSKTGKKVPDVCIDKVFICDQVPPATVALMLMAWRARMSKVIKNPESDGLCYTDKMYVAMRKLIQQSRHRGPVLVFMPPCITDRDESLVFSDAVREAKLRGTRVEVARDPRGLNLSKLEDVRAFLPYLLARTDARAVLLVITREDAVRCGRELDSLRLMLERLLVSKCMPLLCLPPADAKDSKLTAFRKAVVMLCDELCVPYTEEHFAFKTIAKPCVNGLLSVEGQRALSLFLVAAYKHVREAAGAGR